jgi:hypothetical protein
MVRKELTVDILHEVDLNEYGIGLVGDKKQAIPIYKNLF